MKRFFVSLLVLMVLAGAGAAGYFYLAPAQAQGPNQGTNLETVTVGRETLVDTVSATGKIEPEAEVEMKFETGGRVKEVLVRKGQAVTSGTVLARLDTTNLELQVRSAEIDLAQARANLQQLYEPELAEKINAARAAVESARLNLAEMEDGIDPDQVTKAEAALKQTEITLKEAQWAYDQVAYRGDVGAMPQANELQNATLAYESALADYNIAVKEATPAELASARSSLANAQSTLAELLQTPSEAQVLSQQASVDKAQLNLEEAQSNLEDAVLVAPTDGVVVAVNIEPGERVLADDSEAAVTIANTSTYLLKMEVDELDISQVRQGQPATVVLDAFGDQTFEGVVTDISPSPTTSGSDSIVTYEVTISLLTGNQEVNFLSGMTANATIETLRLEDVLVVPTRAVQTERAGRSAITYVEKLDGQGNVMRVEVALGLRSGGLTEVTAGLEEGDRVVIRQQVAVGTGASS